MSILLPHFLNEGRGTLDVYFSRVYNPIWTNPDGFTWMEALRDERQGQVPRRAHADLVGDVVVRRLRAARWVCRPSATTSTATRPTPVAGSASASRCSVGTPRSASGERSGPRRPQLRLQPGRGVGGERVLDRPRRGASTPTASSGSGKWFESKQHPGKPVTVDEYYGEMFAENVPGLAEAAAEAGQTPLEYMRDRSAFAVPADPYEPLRAAGRSRRARRDALLDADGVYRKPGTPGSVGRRPRLRSTTSRSQPLGDGSPAVDIDGEAKEGFPDAVEEARAVLDDAGRLGLARVRHAEVDPVATCTGKTSTWPATSASCCRPSASRR